MYKTDDTKCIQNAYKSIPHFDKHLYTFCTPNKKTMLAKFVCKMYTKILSICAIHFGYNLYTKFIQNVYKNKCMQNEFLISTYFDLFVSQTIKT